MTPVKSAETRFHRSTQRRNGFTAIELVAVIAALAVLTAVVAPAMSSARERSLYTVCRSNLESLLSGVNLYAMDHGEYLPAPGYGLTAPSWAASAPFPVAGSPTVAVVAAQTDAVKRGQIYPYLGGVSPYRCPGDVTNNVRNYNLFRVRTVYTSSYVMNAAACRYGALTDGKSIKATAVPQPEAILLWEADERDPFYFNDFANSPIEGPSVRHGFGVVVGSLSGGVETMGYTDYYKLSGYGGGSSVVNRLWWFKN